MDSTFKVASSDWQVTLTDVEGDTVGNVRISRANGKNFHIVLVDDNVVTPDGKTVGFRQPLLFEHDQGHGKVGDVVIQLRIDPATERYKVQVEQENAFETPDVVQKIWRAVRSSIDNIAQAVKKTVVPSGWLYANPRRIGGKPIKTHYVIAGWSPQLAQQMMDVYDYVQSLDALGLATFLKALQHMPERPARAIFNQMRTPSVSE